MTACSFLTFHLRSIFTVRFTTPFFSFPGPHECVITGHWILYLNLWAYCPHGLHSVISRLLAGGSLGFRIVPLLLHGSQISVRHCCGLVVLFFVYLCHTNPLVIQCYHPSCTLQMPMNWSADHRPCWFFVLFLVFFVCFVFCVFCFVVVFAVRCSDWHGDSSMDYVSIQFSSLLYAHCRQDWCCHWSNSVNLQNAIVFPAW